MASAKRVPVLDPDGRFGTVDESEIDQLPDGARVLSKQEQAQRAVDERYDAMPAAQKALGIVSTAAGALNPLAIGSDPNAPPTAAAFGAGVREGLSGGISDVVTRTAADIAGGTKAGDRYIAEQDDLREASPYAHGVGTVTGMTAGAVMGGESRIARALPGAGLSAGGELLEKAVERGLGGLAKRGALGRAATTAAGMGVRGAVEGGVYGALQQATSDAAHNNPQSGTQILMASGHGALIGGGLGSILGLSGSLAASGVRGASAKIRGALSKGAAEELAAQRAAGVPVPFLTDAELSAGITESAPRAKSPFDFGGAEERPVFLRPGGKARAPAGEEAISIKRGLSIDPDAGLRETADETGRAIHSTGRVRSERAIERIPLADIAPTEVWDPTKLPPLRAAREAGTELDPIRLVKGPQSNAGSQWATIDGIHRTVIAAERGEADILARTTREALPQRLNSDVFNASKPVDVRGGAYRGRFEIGIDPDAGIAERAAGGKFQGKIPTEDAFRLSSAETVPRRVGLAGDAGELAPLETQAPFKLGEGPAATGPKAAGIAGALADPTNAARAFAQDQAWNAVGAGFGLQTTRHAKEAAKYFPNGTRDLGEIALRHGALDMGVANASPIQAAFSAAKSGTPAEILPRLQAAEATVGKRIGDITEASGARIAISDIESAIEDVRKDYAKKAGREHVVAAIDNYRASLLDKLSAGETSVQSVLEQRKFLDELVYEEAKTLDPKGRVAALRQVRSKMEGLITDSLDAASGRVPGELRDEYKALKKDFHGLRILTEAAEDSAARSAKGAGLGLAEKFAVGSAVASGNFAAAPVLAVGGKLLKERGNAAAAAFLLRSAESGAIEATVARWKGRLSKAAAGALREAPEAGARTSSAKTPERAAQTAKEGREAVFQQQKKAEEIVRWVGQMRANPAKVIAQVQEAAAIVGKTSGPLAAEGYTATAMRTIGFVAAHIPMRERRDPLDPRSVPPMTYDEADRLIRAATYATKPETIYDDFEKGIVTPEGLRAAKLFDPQSFEQFQLDLQGRVEDHLLHNRMLTQSQRLRIDKLLGYPAGADLKPATIARLQANLMKPLPEATPADPTGGGGPPPPPVSMQIQQTGFDAVEARRAG